MVTFKRRGVRFKHRVGAIILDAHKRVLLAYSPDGFWFIPGGHVELMESAQETVRREVE
jgi:8-oxo-dGTP pyrophosphatase MutT (NUDIX family)